MYDSRQTDYLGFATNQDLDTFIRIFERLGLPYSLHNVLPFIGELIPPATPVTPKAICIGPYSMRHAARVHGWTPGVYDLFDINFLVQKAHWGKELLNFESLVLPFKEVVLTQPTFVRPIDDSKDFAGTVFAPEKFNAWRRSICEDQDDYGQGLSPDTLVQLCALKEIHAEYRYWVVGGKIATRSRYKLGRRLVYSTIVPESLDAYVLEVTSACSWLPNAFVIDVCETPQGPKIVEINTLNAAGFYAGDIQRIVMALEELEA